MPRPAMNLKRINVFLEPSVLDAMKWLSEARGTTVSELIRIATKQYALREVRKEQEDVQTLSFTNPQDAA